MNKQISKKTAEKGPQQKHHLFKYVSAKYLRLETRVCMKNTENQPSKTLEHLAELKYNIYVCTSNVGTTLESLVILGSLIFFMLNTP